MKTPTLMEPGKLLDDSQIRAGATIKLFVGDHIWAYARGRRASTLAGELDGTSLAINACKEVPELSALVDSSLAGKDQDHTHDNSVR
jgi:hypothetical protein